MRYLVALIIGIGALFCVNAFADLFSMPRPWNSLLMGATVGITMVVVLLIWEVVKPSNKDAAPAKPAMSEEERANARAERRARLAAEAGVSLDDSDRSEPDAASQESDESSIEAEPTEVESGQDERDEAETAQDERRVDEAAQDEDGDTGVGAGPGESETSAPDEVDEEATGSSLESPPTGEPGASVGSTEDAPPEPDPDFESAPGFESDGKSADGDGSRHDGESAEADKARDDRESTDVDESSDGDDSGDETVPGGPAPKS
ncbi:hypothetical protein [Brevibacterium marinum]|uniref:Uncharacterized protein n=1 Tax=Brevibacterium marinum TaxID=418643 RepID=A0A846RPM2_9MICO|nr:hypothetical protein [Brevibacterium marinum]NJC55884.1 hypothetical protein [Brevibacterium marinum]